MSKLLSQWSPSQSAIDLIKLNGLDDAHIEKSVNYLKNHPKIHNNMTFLVRHLQPTEKGIPIQIYVFATTIDWEQYEGIQADIFDHVLAVIPEFELRVFQFPSNADVFKLMSGNTNKLV